VPYVIGTREEVREGVGWRVNRPKMGRPRPRMREKSMEGLIRMVNNRMGRRRRLKVASALRPH